MGVKKQRKMLKVRTSKGRLDDATHAVIQALFFLQWSINSIAKACNCHWSTAKRVVNSVRPSDRTKPLPPRIPTAAKAAIVLRRKRVKYLAGLMETKVGPHPKYEVISKKKFQSCAEISDELLRRHGGKKVSNNTILRDLTAVGKVCKGRPKGPVRQMLDPGDRLKFCKRTLSDSKAGRLNLNEILFSDEKWYNTNDHGCTTEYCDPDEYATRRVFDRYAAKCRVWGVIGVGVKKLIFLPEGNINSASYVRDSLEPTRRLLQRGVFMQDGARAHTASSTIRWLENNHVRMLEDWPPRSPDLNPIENLWAYTCKCVAKRQPTSSEELAQYLKEEWDALPQSLIDDLVLSFAGRLQECVRLKGESIVTKSRGR